QGGLRAPALERHLAPHGLTLGHFPQSYEYVSLGGCAATRSAGQASTGYGTIAGMLLGLRLAAPTADIDLPPLPATAAGPGLRQLLVGSEGSPQQVRARRRHTLELARSYDGLALGRAPGEAWRRSRFEGPYLRDELLTHGVMVETLETAAQWSRVGTLHREVGDAIEQALRACGTPGLAMCHISHVYESGASLYFTFLARRRQTDELGQWRA